MRKTVRRYVPRDEAQQRGPRLAALLASGLERLLKKEAPEGLAIPPNLSLYMDAPSDRAEEEK
jgi:hypothetical protein